MKIKQYIPPFMDFSDEPIIVEFNTIEELKAIPFVKRHTDNENHHQLSITVDQMIMSENRGGVPWTIVGRLLDGEANLPEFTYKPQTHNQSDDKPETEQHQDQPIMTTTINYNHTYVYEDNSIIDCTNTPMDSIDEYTEEMNMLIDEMRNLKTALHDAIDSPKGVVPSSADRFYDQDYYE